MKMTCLREKVEEIVELLDELIEKEKKDHARKCIKLVKVVPQAGRTVFVKMKDGNCELEGMVDISSLDECNTLKQWGGSNFLFCDIHADSVVWNNHKSCGPFVVSVMDIYDLFIEQTGR